MQIALRCKYCGNIHISDNDNDLCLEIDFHDCRIRFVCKKCKKENSMLVSDEKLKQEKPLPRMKTSPF